jgi:FMN phosphatase YigB (HAD superfamily)
VSAVGFDLDGTLYDEFEFVHQAYAVIAPLLAAASGAATERVFAALSARWLEMGSSYPHIFEEVLGADLPPAEREEVVRRCVRAYRACRPVLALPKRVEILLAALGAKHPLFLITDGSPGTQQAKIDALHLARFVPAERTVLTGAHGGDCTKPGAGALVHLPAHLCADPARVVFFGDRACDRGFAAAAGFQFVEVWCMIRKETA